MSVYLQSCFGSIAQLVQSICLTSRGSGVRLPLLPLKKRFWKFRISFSLYPLPQQNRYTPTSPDRRVQRKISAQRKISVVLHFSPHQHKAGGASPLGVARAACFEQLAGVFASCGALHYAKILASLKIKNGISLTPLNYALNAFTFALNDSADAFVERLSKQLSIV